MRKLSSQRGDHAVDSSRRCVQYTPWLILQGPADFDDFFGGRGDGRLVEQAGGDADGAGPHGFFTSARIA